jgi:hypothetical protein
LLPSLYFRGVSVSYGAEFEATAGDWTEMLVPLALLTPTVPGETLQGPPIDPALSAESAC